ncbi:hypothetical protein [Aequorivita antarctica]|uniref:Curlin n=1 Tax=Aequorivita antarctica TaxID=153266 RepID=A0A5C6YZB5_9FLAO|nr:hypothetical protein [Aequorivita antarctica]TXD72608.1 hypothetical protein ESU54_12415 [Aequorivita antarctica]SRX76156.1 hypothetical protein AEQU3_03154 [Aequorivita antarctica]
MKTIFKQTVFVLAFFLFTNVALSQTYGADDKNPIVLEGENITPLMLANLGIISSPNPKNALIQGNSVSVQQIGEYNTTDIRTNTNASEINLLQNGNSNDTKLEYTANTAVADLVQNGNNNRIVDFVNNPNADISLDLEQNGNNYFERDGVNEITKSLKFRQTEGSPDLIIRSSF